LNFCGGGKFCEFVEIGLKEQNIKGNRGFYVIIIVGIVQPTIQMCMAETIVGEIV
jgi:hypothetical protein